VSGRRRATAVFLKAGVTIQKFEVWVRRQTAM
jgi:hypothetical protein